MHCGIPSDCPHVERRGYTGDGQLTCNAAMIQLDGAEVLQEVDPGYRRLPGFHHRPCPVYGTIHSVRRRSRRLGLCHCHGSVCLIIAIMETKQILKELYPQMLHYLDYLENTQ